MQNLMLYNNIQLLNRESISKVRSKRKKIGEWQFEALISDTDNYFCPFNFHCKKTNKTLLDAEFNALPEHITPI